MTDKPADLSTLIERVEAAEAGDRGLDTAIWLAVVATPSQLESIKIGRDVYGKSEECFRTSRMMDGFCPSASVDAAMTLIPEGAWLRIDQWPGRPATASIQPIVEPPVDASCATAADPALALTAACLRAKMETDHAE